MASSVATIQIRSHNCQEGNTHLKYNSLTSLISLFGELVKTVGHKKNPRKTNPQTHSQKHWAEQGKTMGIAALNTLQRSWVLDHTVPMLLSHFLVLLKVVKKEST